MQICFEQINIFDVPARSATASRCSLFLCLPTAAWGGGHSQNCCIQSCYFSELKQLETTMIRVGSTRTKELWFIIVGHFGKLSRFTSFWFRFWSHLNWIRYLLITIWCYAMLKIKSYAKLNTYFCFLNLCIKTAMEVKVTSDSEYTLPVRIWCVCGCFSCSCIYQALFLTIQYNLKSLQQALLYGTDRSNMATAQSLLCVKRWIPDSVRTWISVRAWVQKVIGISSVGRLFDVGCSRSHAVRRSLQMSDAVGILVPAYFWLQAGDILEPVSQRSNVSEPRPKTWPCISHCGGLSSENHTVSSWS